MFRLFVDILLLLGASITIAQNPIPASATAAPPALTAAATTVNLSNPLRTRSSSRNLARTVPPDSIPQDPIVNVSRDQTARPCLGNLGRTVLRGGGRVVGIASNSERETTARALPQDPPPITAEISGNNQRFSTNTYERRQLAMNTYEFQ